MLPRNKIPPACWQIWMSQWSELLQSGIPVLDALELSMELQGNGRQSRLLRANLQRSLQFLKTGQNLQTAFRAAFGALPQALEVALLCAQASGDLAQALDTQLQRWKKTSTAHQALGKSLIYPVVVLLLAIACWIFLHQVSSPHIHTDKTNMDQSVNTAEILMIVGGLLLLMSGAAHLIGRHQTAGIHWLPHNAWQASDFYHVIACELHAGLDLMHCLRYRAMPANRWLAWTSAGNNPLASLNTLSLLIQRHLKEGLPLSQAMTRAKAPAFLIRQSQLAEQTGNLSHCFSLAAKVYEMQAISAQQRLQSTLPPMALALAAATLAMAYQFTLAPLYANLAGLV
jgi:type II secretory pathway component PulF